MEAEICHLDGQQQSCQAKKSKKAKQKAIVEDPHTKWMKDPGRMPSI
jgi:hypothetical protein